MKKTLRQGGTVEFPLGKLVRVRRHFSKEWDSVDDWPAHRQRYTVAWELDEAGDRLLNPERRRPRRGDRKSGKRPRIGASRGQKSGK